MPHAISVISKSHQPCANLTHPIFKRERKKKPLYPSKLLQLKALQRAESPPNGSGKKGPPAAAASPGQIHEQVRRVGGLGLARLGDVVVVALARVDAHHQDDAQDHGGHGRRQVVGDRAQPDLLRQRQVQRACG